MSITKTDLPGVFLIEPELVEDRRGFFARLYDEEELARVGVDTRVAQHSIAFNDSMATIRGLHYQQAPYGETKLVRCTTGAVFDVVVDLRQNSPTRHRWVDFELSASNRTALIIPPGCAHGDPTLTAGAELTYLISVPYMKTAQRGVRWDDPVLKIRWPRAPLVIGERDAALPLLEL